ncbi:hypothetical protein ACH4VR_29585 [Streptomyces sp. NPDC020883]|uniref:hypothetical protein n=1 Tax=Streptomyces sp. NPDC020883 TaxID=3365099 RepID=UPI00378A40E1
MSRIITWPTRQEWQARAEQAERSSCHARDRVSPDPAHWLPAAEVDEGHKLAAKLIRPTRIALGAAGRAGERPSLNQWYRDARDQDATVDAVASGWWHLARYARSVEVMPEVADRLTALADTMRRGRDAAAREGEDKAVSETIARRATDEAWERELRRRARVPQTTTITVHEDGTSTVSAPKPYNPPVAALTPSPEPPRPTATPPQSGGS